MRSALVEPIHVEAVGLGNIRFFRPPSGAQEFPWPCLDDVSAAMPLPRSLRRAFAADLRSSEWGRDVKTVATAAGIVTVVPHYQIQGLFHAMTDVGRCPSDFYWNYTKAGAAALDKITDGFSKDQLFAYLKAALAAGGGVA